MSETCLNTDFGSFELLRLPRRRRELLRAWDTADENLLQCVHENRERELHTSSQQRPVLIVNDGFGALSVSLNQYDLINWSDSFLAHEACRQNWQLNNLQDDAIQYLDSLSVPHSPIDIALIKVPKTLALLEYQLLRLKPYRLHYGIY